MRHVNRAEGKDMKKNITVLTLCAMLFVLGAAAEAQQAKKMARIGYLSPQSGPPPTLGHSRRV